MTQPHLSYLTPSRPLVRVVVDTSRVRRARMRIAADLEPAVSNDTGAGAVSSDTRRGEAAGE